MWSDRICNISTVFYSDIKTMRYNLQRQSIFEVQLRIREVMQRSFTPSKLHIEVRLHHVILHSVFYIHVFGLCLISGRTERDFLLYPCLGYLSPNYYYLEKSRSLFMLLSEISRLGPVGTWRFNYYIILTIC